MAMFNTQAPTYNSGGASQLIKQASESPLKGMSKVMGELSGYLDDRVKDRYTTEAIESMSGAKSLSDIQSLGIDMNKLSDSGKQQYSSSLDMLNRLGQEEARKQSMELQQNQEERASTTFGNQQDEILKNQITNEVLANWDSMTPEQRQQAKQYSGLDSLVLDKTLADKKTTSLQQQKLKADIAKANRITPKSITETEQLNRDWNNMSPERKTELRNLGVYSASAYGKFIDNQFKTQTASKRDALKQMTDAFNLANPNATPQQTQDFNKQALHKLTYGTGDTANEKNLAERDENYKAVQGWKGKYLDNVSKVSGGEIGNMKSIENSNMNKMDGTQKQVVKDTIKAMKGNYLVVSNIDDALNRPSAKNVKKGVVDSTKTWVEKKVGKETAQAMTDVDFNTRAGRILLSYLKSTSGTAVSDMERKFIQDVMLGGDLTDERYVIQALSTFRDSVASENDISAGMIFDDAPHSAVTLRQYKTYKNNKDTTESNSVFR